MPLTDEEKRLVGGSDAAAIAGVHPWKSAIDVYERVTTGYEKPAGKEARRGQLMEPVIRGMAVDELGLKLLGPRKLRDPKRDYIRASLDDVAQAEDSEEVVEFKSVSGFAAQDYGLGDDEVPQHHLCQVQFYMDKAGLPRARLVALIGVDDLRQYVIQADADVQGMLVEAVDRFWVDHVRKSVPPPPDHSESYAEYLARKYPQDNGTMLAPTPRFRSLKTELQKTKDAIKGLEEREQQIRNQILSDLGDAAGVEGLFTYKWTRGRNVTDWDAVAREHGVPQAIIDKHSRKSPFRVLRLQKGKDE